MNNFFKTLALSSAFALVGCDEQSHEWAKTGKSIQIMPSAPSEIFASITLDSSDNKNTDINELAATACKRVYILSDQFDNKSCTIHVVDNRNSKQGHGTVKADCETSPWQFRPKHCVVTKEFKPL